MSAILEVDQLVVFGAERHPPDLLAGRLARPRAARSASSSLLENRPACSLPSATMMAPVSVARSIMNCGLKRSCAVPEHVGQHEPAFGVGVDDLDGLAGHRGDDVAGTLRIAVGHVLDEADDADDVDLGLARGQRVHQADHGSRAAHVALHVLHAGGRLDRNAAGVEDDALADEGDRLGPSPCRRSTA